MDQHSKSELIRSYRKAYASASKREKTRIVSTIVESTGYCRKHVIHALNKDITVPKKVRRKRVSRYAHLYDSLVRIWAAANFICGKRLQPFMPGAHPQPQAPQGDSAQQARRAQEDADRRQGHEDLRYRPDPSPEADSPHSYCAPSTNSYTSSTRHSHGGIYREAAIPRYGDILI